MSGRASLCTFKFTTDRQLPEATVTDGRTRASALSSNPIVVLRDRSRPDCGGPVRRRVRDRAVRTGAAPAVAARVFNAQVALLYRKAPPSLVFSMVAGVLVCWLLDGAIPRPTLRAWFAGMVVLNAARLVLVRAHRRDSAVEARVDRWADRKSTRLNSSHQ